MHTELCYVYQQCKDYHKHMKGYEGWSRGGSPSPTGTAIPNALENLFPALSSLNRPKPRRLTFSTLRWARHE